MRDLEFSSSARRGNGAPKAPERVLGAQIFFSILAPKSAKFTQKSENWRKSHFLRQGAKRLIFVTVFGYFWRPEMQKNELWSKIPSFPHFGAKMRKVR